MKLNKSNIKFVTFGQAISFIEIKGFCDTMWFSCYWYKNSKFLNGIQYCFVIEYFKISKENIKTMLTTNWITLKTFQSVLRALLVNTELIYFQIKLTNVKMLKLSTYWWKCYSSSTTRQTYSFRITSKS